MAFLNVKNRARSTLAAGITLADVALAVKAGEGSKFPASNFHITIQDEILLCSSRVTDNFTVIRAQESTIAAPHIIGKSVELRITAGVITELQNASAATFALDDLSAQCDGANKVFNTLDIIADVVWLSLGGGILIEGLDFNKTNTDEITVIGKYDIDPPDTGEDMYIKYTKA